MPTSTGATEAEEHVEDDVARLLSFLEDRDVDCPLFGYNLRNLTQPRCPECRQELMLNVGVRVPRLGWLITALAPSMFSGIAAIFLCVPITVS